MLHSDPPAERVADLLLVGSTAARAPSALVTEARAEGWSTLALGAEREALEGPELFAIIAGRKEPVEITEPSTNPALAHSRLARSSLGVRWLFGVPCSGLQARSMRSSLSWTPNLTSCPGVSAPPWSQLGA